MLEAILQKRCCCKWDRRHCFEQIYLKRKLILGEPFLVCLLLRYFRRTLFAAAKSEVSGAAGMARTTAHPLEEFFELSDRKPDEEMAVVYDYILRLLRRLHRLISCLCFPNKIHNFQNKPRTPC